MKGFGGMSPEKRREIASKGGTACQSSGRAHRFTREEASEAGRKGGLVVSADRVHMSRIGQKGGRFASRDPAKMREIGRLGGIAAHAQKSD